MKNVRRSLIFLGLLLTVYIHAGEHKNAPFEMNKEIFQAVFRGWPNGFGCG